MSVLSTPDRALVAEWDLDRVEFVRAARVWLLPVDVMLRGGPCDGWSQRYELAPDLFRLEWAGRAGRYVPLVADPTIYLWIGETVIC